MLCSLFTQESCLNKEIVVHIERANKHCKDIECTSSINIGSISAERQKIIYFKRTAKTFFIITTKTLHILSHLDSLYMYTAICMGSKVALNY